MAENGKPEERMLTERQSLQSIAVELHRGNQLKAHEIQVQAKQLEILERISRQLENPQGAEYAAKSLEMMERSLLPLQDLVGMNAERRPIAQVETLPPTEPAVQEVTTAGTRIRQAPPSVRIFDGPDVV